MGREEQVMRFRHALTTRLVLSHILVATLTGMSIAGAFILVFVATRQTTSPAAYRQIAETAAARWLFGPADGQLNRLHQPVEAPGFILVVESDQTIAYSQGDTNCRAGQQLPDCASELTDRPPGERFIEVGGERWVEFILPTVTGQRLITQRDTAAIQPSIGVAGTYVRGLWPFAVTLTLLMGIASLPVALVLSWLFARPLARRLNAIAAASRRFATGDLASRVGDQQPDEVGDLARQFDAMAEALEQNLGILRDLVQRNAELANQAEQSAVQAERTRLSRDLHDAIAQHLFSLSVSTATLPDLIQRDHDAGADQARAVARLAEQTLLDLRSLLVELRPAALVRHSLGDALEELCGEWQAAQAIPVECSLVLTGQHLPPGIEDVVYRVTQEALSNIAKHAGATAVSVSLLQGQRQVTLSVTDNGRGIAANDLERNGQFGLIGMRERARSVGAKLSIESDTQRGTTVRLTVPLEAEDN